MSHVKAYYGYTRKILENENSLSEDERISLVFLMCDNVKNARYILAKNIAGCHESYKILPDLLKSEDISDIHHKFVESLILIKNYQLIKLLGYSLDDIKKLIIKYKMSENKYYVNLVRKSLFRMCESMTCGELAKLMLLIKCDFTERKRPLETSKFTQMEINLLYCIDEGYISDGTGHMECDVNSLIKHLIKMGKHDLAKSLAKFHRSDLNGTEEILESICSKDKDCVEKCSVLEVTSTSGIHSNGNTYSMDVDNMGFCIIVNQRNFIKDDLLNYCGNQMDERHGTNYDRDLLRITFTGLGYKVKILENLKSDCLRKSIGEIILQVTEKHSSFVLCILSHGKRDAVYGVDGIEVHVEEIEDMIVKCLNLLGKPKLLFIQACQGNDFQKALPCIQAEDDFFCMPMCDGPSNSVQRKFAPKADLLTYWATVPGYASIRFLYAGTVFIQTLCAQLLKHGNSHPLDDIFKGVNLVLGRKQFGTDSKVVTPQVKHSFTKQLYFPYSSQKRCQAAEMLFLKYFIEALINECIIKVSALKIHRKKSKS